MMKRNYTRTQFLDKIRRVRALRPDISLSSDFIIGFPSETEDDFQQTMDLIDEAGCDFAYSFLYSPRPGTPAANLRDNVPLEDKQRRLQTLQARIRELDEAYKQRLVGSTQKVLVERASTRGQGQVAGRTSSNRMVNFDGTLQMVGQMVDVFITEVQPNSLRGRLLS